MNGTVGVPTWNVFVFEIGEILYSGSRHFYHDKTDLNFISLVVSPV